METEEHITLAKKWLRSSGQFSKSSPSLWSTKIVHTAIGERERDTKASPAKLFTDVVFDLSHADFCYYRSEYQPPAEIYPLALMWPKGVKISRVHLENTDTHDWCLEPEPTLKDGKQRQRERESERKKDMWLGAMHIQRFGGRAGYMAVRKDVSMCACMCAWGVCESCGQQQMAGLVPLGGERSYWPTLFFWCMCINDHGCNCCSQAKPTVRAAPLTYLCIRLRFPGMSKWKRDTMPFVKRSQSEKSQF